MSDITVPARITFLDGRSPVDGYAILSQGKALVGISYGQIPYMGTVWFNDIGLVAGTESGRVFYSHKMLKDVE